MDTEQQVKRVIKLADFTKINTRVQRKKNKNYKLRHVEQGLRIVNSAPDSPYKRMRKPRIALRPLVRKANRIITLANVDRINTPSIDSSQRYTFDKENRKVNAVPQNYSMDIKNSHEVALQRRNSTFDKENMQAITKQRRHTIFDQENNRERASQIRCTFGHDTKRERAFSQLLTYDLHSPAAREGPMKFLYLTEDCYDIMRQPAPSDPFVVDMSKRERKKLRSLRRSCNY